MFTIVRRHQSPSISVSPHWEFAQFITVDIIGRFILLQMQLKGDTTQPDLRKMSDLLALESLVTQEKS